MHYGNWPRVPKNTRSLGELHEVLDAHYPGLAQEGPVDVVSFEID